MNRFDTTLWETEREDDDTCVELDHIPGTHNWWCRTAPKARALAEQHAASLGPGWTVDHDARPRPHYHVVQVVRDPVTGRQRWRRLRDGGHYFYGGKRPYRRRPGRDELAAPELAASGRWARAGDVIVVFGADGDQALAREPRAAAAAELERESDLELGILDGPISPSAFNFQQITTDPSTGPWYAACVNISIGYGPEESPRVNKFQFEVGFPASHHLGRTEIADAQAVAAAAFNKVIVPALVGTLVNLNRFDIAKRVERLMQTGVRVNGRFIKIPGASVKGGCMRSLTPTDWPTIH